MLATPRRGRRRLALAAVVTLLAAGLLWGLGSALAASPSASPGGKTILRMGWTVDPDSLNPFIGFLSSSY